MGSFGKMFYIRSVTLLSLFTYILHAKSNFTLLDITLNEPMAAHFTAIYNNSMMVIAGWDSEMNSRSKYAVISFPMKSNTWNEYSAILPQMDVDGQMGIQIDDTVYIINPFHRSYIPSAIRYSLSSNTYTELATPIKYGDGSCIVYYPNNNIIYAMIGDTTQTYDIINDEWIQVADTSVCTDYYYLGGCALDINHDNIYYFGGFDCDGESLDRIKKYNIINNEWSIITTTLGTARSGLTCHLLSSDDSMYCIGGATGSRDSYVSSNKVDVFDPITEQIIKEMSLNIARDVASVALWNDGKCIIVSGGFDINDAVLDSIEYTGDCSGAINAETKTTTEPSHDPTTDPTTRNPTTGDPATGDPTTGNPTTGDPTSTPLFTSTVYSTSESIPTNDTYSDTDQGLYSSRNNIVLWIVLISVAGCCCCFVCGAAILYKSREKASLFGIGSVSVDDVAVSKPSVANMEIMRIPSLQSVSNCNNNDVVLSEIGIWLRDVVQLPVYHNIFVMNGFETLVNVKMIKDKATLQQMGVIKFGHQTRLMREIKKIQQHVMVVEEVPERLTVEGDNDGFWDPQVIVSGSVRKKMTVEGDNEDNIGDVTQLKTDSGGDFAVDDV